MAYFILITDIILFVLLVVLLKRNLYFFFKQTIIPLILLVWCWEVYFSLHITHKYNLKYFSFMRSHVYFEDNFPIENMTILDLLICMIISLLSNVPYFILLYLSIYDIKFKEYLENLMRGLMLKDYYDGASIWVILRYGRVEDSFANLDSLQNQNTLQDYRLDF